MENIFRTEKYKLPLFPSLLCYSGTTSGTKRTEEIKMCGHKESTVPQLQLVLRDTKTVGCLLVGGHGSWYWTTEALENCQEVSQSPTERASCSRRLEMPQLAYALSDAFMDAFTAALTPPLHSALETEVVWGPTSTRSMLLKFMPDGGLTESSGELLGCWV